MNQQKLILGVGELLWDLLPQGARLGGAPANYCVMAGRLGARAVILSRIGDDNLGIKALDTLRPMPVHIDAIQMDPQIETGRVSVELKDGQPSYNIHQPAAWDEIEASDDWLALAAHADAICFGSLAQRSPKAHQTISRLVEVCQPSSVRVFDVNLRAPFYSSEIISASIKLASVVKMNDVEVPLVVQMLGLAHNNPQIENTAWGLDDLKSGAEIILAAFVNIDLIAITRGGDGSLLVKRDEWHAHPGIPIHVADTIGAGDAFTAAMTCALLHNEPLKVMNEAGNRWGAYIASQQGAMPPITDQIKQQIHRQVRAATAE